MNPYNTITDDWIYLVILISFAVMFFHQSWANLIQKKVSSFSIDRLIILLSEKFANEKNKIETMKLSKDPKRIVFQGLIALFAFIGFLRNIFEWITKHF
jgi:hypothetical protein